MKTRIETTDELRKLYRQPSGRAKHKVLPRMDMHMKRFLELSPFLVLSTFGADGTVDASPRGGRPGFVKTLDDGTLLIPDWPGNNRLDSGTNIIETGNVATLFLIPGVKECLRINGRAELCIDPEIRSLCTVQKKDPKLVIKISISEAYLHCSKAIMRAKIWESEVQIERGQLATMNEMLNAQLPQELVVIESPEEMEQRYRDSLY